MLNRLKAILADFFQQADLVLLGLCCTATVYGIMMIYSATRYSNSNRPVIVQSVALLLGICVYIFLSMVDIEIVMKKWKWMVGINIVLIGLLLTPLGIGGETTGNQAWLQIPGIPFNIGPAEVVKITFSLLLAKQLAWQREGEAGFAFVPFRSYGGRSHTGFDGLVCGNLRGHGQRPDLLFHLFVHGVCGRLCPPVVCPALCRMRRRCGGGLDAGFDSLLHEKPLSGPF